MVVDVEPSVKGSTAGAVGAVDGGIGAFFDEGPVEPFDLAVDLGSADGNPSVDRPGGGERLLEVAAEVGPGVVGHDPADDDAVGSEPGGGPGPEGGAGRAPFVVEDLEVGQAAVVV